MGRGSNLADGGVSIDEGLDPTGVRTVIHFQGDQVIFERSQDMTAALLHVQQMRERNEGKGWGEGREVGYIPPLFHAKISLIQDVRERKQAVKQFFRDNPAFCAYPPYLKR